jgi:hypothetical protein
LVSVSLLASGLPSLLASGSPLGSVMRSALL